MILQVQGKLSKNEIAVPVMFRGNAGIPEVYGVIMEDDNTLIFQEFAGKCKPCRSLVLALLLRDAFP